MIDLSGLPVFSTIFLSILMQALPFMLIGIFVSSVMHLFISDAFIVKLFPTKSGLGFISALFAGLLFPVCECAIVPVVTRLVKKGVALPIAVTFMLSAPIINPIVIVSTLYAFPGQPEVAFFRVILGLLIAFIVGIILFLRGDNQTALLGVSLHDDHSRACACGEEDGHECACQVHNRDEQKSRGIVKKAEAFFLHAGDEFFNVGKFLVLGAFVTSLIQTAVPKAVFIHLGGQNGLALLIMMAMAFLFSACSTSDAFIARSYVDRFSMGAIMGFMVFGPMMDVKNILMLMASFKRSFVARLVFLIITLNFITLCLFAFVF